MVGNSFKTEPQTNVVLPKCGIAILGRCVCARVGFRSAPAGAVGVGRVFAVTATNHPVASGRVAVCCVTRYVYVSCYVITLQYFRGAGEEAATLSACGLR